MPDQLKRCGAAGRLDADLALLDRLLLTCNDYANGEAAIGQVQCPVLFLLGEVDQMAPPSASNIRMGKARRTQVVTVQAGHALMSEALGAVLCALRDVVTAPSTGWARHSATIPATLK